MSDWRTGVLVTAFVLAASVLPAQDNAFPEGDDGELYYCPRLDLVPEDAGGPLAVELDGFLEDVAWTRAAWQSWSNASDMPRGDALPPDLIEVGEDKDLDIEWAAVCDENFLYVAWRISDDFLQNTEIDILSGQCDVWRDDSVELYIDANNNGPECLAGDQNCYEDDDIQLTVGAFNIVPEDQDGDPEMLVFGGVGAGGACDFSGPHPEVMQGVVREIRDPDEDVYAGWQAELAIALETMGNDLGFGPDGTPMWKIDPQHGRVIGWNVHGQDDDLGGDRDHKLMWSLREVTESAWRNPDIFGKLMFVDPTKEPPPLVSPVLNVSCERNESGSVTVLWQNPASADPFTPTRIHVDGQLVRQVSGAASNVVLTEEQVPQDDQDHTITITNNSMIPVECVVLGSPFDECGGIRTWNILGAFDNPGGAAPGEESIQLDYMTDGDVEETEFEWFPGATIETDFGGAAASTIIDGGAAGRNPDGTPEVFSRSARSARVDFQSSQVFGSNLNFVMAYAQAYIIVEEDSPALGEDVFLGMSSDDSIQVLFNGLEVWLNDVPRAGADACNPQDVGFDPVELQAGVNDLIVKIFEGEGGWEFAVRFQNILGDPVTEGISVSLTRPEEPMEQFRRGDTDTNGNMELTDAIGIFNFLFITGVAPVCLDAADADDNGAIELTDGIRILNVLFLGFGEIPPPGFVECGVDSSADAFGPCVYPDCG